MRSLLLCVGFTTVVVSVMTSTIFAPGEKQKMNTTAPFWIHKPSSLCSGHPISAAAFPGPCKFGVSRIFLSLFDRTFHALQRAQPWCTHDQQPPANCARRFCFRKGTSINEVSSCHLLCQHFLLYCPSGDNTRCSSDQEIKWVAFGVTWTLCVSQFITVKEILLFFAATVGMKIHETGLAQDLLLVPLQLKYVIC